MGRCLDALLVCSSAFAVAAQAAPINVALNKPATANSSYNASSLPLFAVDGNWGTGWGAGDHGAPAPNENWIMVDLESIFDPVEIILGNTHNPSYPGYTLDYILEYSDGSTDGGGSLIWTFIADDQLVDLPPTDPLAEPPLGPYAHAWDMSGAVENAQFVRVRFDGGIPGRTHWTGLAELMVMADPEGPEAAIPEPASMGLLALGLLALRRRRR